MNCRRLGLELPPHPPLLPPLVQVEPSPVFFPPEVIQAEPLVEPEYVAPEPPVGAEAPPAPVIGKAQYGHDWTGNRPFTVRESRWAHRRGSFL